MVQATKLMKSPNCPHARTQRKRGLMEAGKSIGAFWSFSGYRPTPQYVNPNVRTRSGS